MENNRSIILLSAGLDSLVSLGLAKEKDNITLGLTFDYGQKSRDSEINYSKKICEYYGIEHRIIKLDWLKSVTETSLVSDREIPTGENLEDLNQSMKSVWVPNRNGLFLNIAGSIADGKGYNKIFIGANKEEGVTFPDNTKEFISRVNSEFEYSTLNKIRVEAPLIDKNKNEIVKLAVENNIPLELVMSCYKGLIDGKHCGKCESCMRLKSALMANNANEYLKILF